MKNLNFFRLSLQGVILRFYMMMAVVLIAGFSGTWLFGLLALPIFLSIMLGVSNKKSATPTKTVPSTNYALKATPKEKLAKVA